MSAAAAGEAPEPSRPGIDVAALLRRWIPALLVFAVSLVTAVWSAAWAVSRFTTSVENLGEGFDAMKTNVENNSAAVQSLKLFVEDTIRQALELRTQSDVENWKLKDQLQFMDGLVKLNPELNLKMPAVIGR